MSETDKFTNLAFTVDIGDHFFVGESRVELVRHYEGTRRVRILVTARQSVEVDRRTVRERKQRERKT